MRQESYTRCLEKLRHSYAAGTTEQKTRHTCRHARCGRPRGFWQTRKAGLQTLHTKRLPVRMRGAQDPAAPVLSMRDGAAAVEMPCESSAKNQTEPLRELAVHPWVHFPKNQKLGLKDSNRYLHVHGPSGIFTTAERGSDAPCVCEIRTRWEIIQPLGRNTGACSAPRKPRGHHAA